MVLTTETDLKELGSGRAIYIPKELWVDSQFPFEKGDRIKISIHGKKLIVEGT